MKSWLLSAIYAFLITAATVGLSYILYYSFGDKCWPQRFGAIVVGIGIAIEALAIYDPTRNIGGWDDLGPRAMLMKTAILTALLGTILWGFGDLIFQNYGQCKIL